MAPLRLSTLDTFARTLLISLGVAVPLGCGADVSQVDDDGGGSGGAPTNTGGSTQQGGAPNGPGQGPTTSTQSTSTAVGGAPAHGCENPQPVIVNNVDTGVDTCDGGQLRRREQVECPANFPDTNPCCG